ncbi:MAG TPA: hypothetical protein VFS08_07245 [Gemmatimonadaceae bacterium]|nr:hypothetical protein [Gemmatimonadaceae bacterium]
MFGCLRRVGCLVILLAVGAGAYLLRDRWYPRLMGGGAVESESVETAVWEPVTEGTTTAGRRKVARLEAPRGPSAVVLQPAELAGYLLGDALRQLSGASDGVGAAVVGDRVYVRAAVRLRDLGGEALGPLAGMLGDRDTLLLGGTLEIVRPGLGVYHVRDVRVKEFALPAPVIRKLLPRLRGSDQPPGVPDDALAMRVPAEIADVRVAHGQVTLYEEARP